CFVLVSALVDDWQTKFALLALLAGLFLTVQVLVQPFQHHTMDNRLEQTALFFLAVIAALNATQWFDEDPVRGVSVALYYGFVVVWAGAMMYAKFKARQLQGSSDNNNGDGRREWLWWQTLCCWYLAPRTKYLTPEVQDGLDYVELPMVE